MNRLIKITIFIVLMVWGYPIFAQTPNPTLSKLTENSAIDLGGYKCTDTVGEPTGRCAFITDYSGMVFDKTRRQLVAFGGGHTSTNYDAVNTFSTDSLVWSEKYKPTACSAITAAGNYNLADGTWLSGPTGPYPRPAARHTLDLLVVPDGLDEFIVMAGVEGNYSCPNMNPPYTGYNFASGTAKIAHYNFSSNQWTFSKDSGSSNYPTAEYDPVSGKIIVLGLNGLEIYDPVTKIKTMAINLSSIYWIRDEQGTILPAGTLGYNNHLVYFPPNQKMYYFERGSKRVFEITLNRSNFSQTQITRLDTFGTHSPHGEPGYAFDSTNRIIGGGVHQNKFYAFNPLTKTWTSKAIQGGSPGNMAFHAIDYDPHNNVFVFVTDAASGRKTWAYRYATGTSPSDFTAPSVPQSLSLTVASSSQINLAWATSTDNIGVAGYRIFRNGTQIAVSSTPGYQSTGLSPSTTYTYTVAAYDAAGNVSGQSTSASATTQQTVSTPPPSAVVSGDFQARCATAGVIRCIGFDAATDISGKYGSNSGVMAGTSTTAVLDSSVKASGNSSLKFTIPSNSSANAAGTYFTNFSSDLSAQFGENSEFYVQWRQRLSPEMLGVFTGTTWKQVIIGTGDQPGKPYASCTDIDVVAVNYYSHNFPVLYHSCSGSSSHGPYDGLYASIPNDYNLQNGRPSPYCLYTQGRTTPTSFFPPKGNCFGYAANEWMTFQIHVKAGPRVNDEFKDSYINMWVAREGQPSQQVLNFGPYNLTAGSLAENQKFGKIWLLPYMTNKDANQVHATAYTWYDELIISRQRIPDPTINSSTKPPAPPSNVSLK